MKKATRRDDLEVVVGALGQSFIALSIQCARCHFLGGGLTNVHGKVVKAVLS